LTIPVTITPPAAGSVSVSVTGGSVAANDYSLNTSSLNFTTANPTQNISLTLTDDSVVEANETLILTLSSPVGANLGDAEHTLTITDNDAAPPSGETLVIVSANTTSGNFQQYEGPGDRIFQALDPDIVGIQEFNVPGDDLRGWVDVTFGPEFHFSIEPGDEQIPNGVISRYPITASGEFIDPEVSNRDFAWATIDIPGDIDLHVISVHFLTSNSSDRSAQAANLINNINTTFPSTDYIVLCGDFNTTSRSSNEVNTLKQVFSDTHVPVDQNNNSDTNANRNNPYDWVMPNTTLDALHTTYTLNGVDFPDGLVFDTRVWPSNNVPSPALANDSGASQMQHMAIIKAFTLPDIPPPVTETSRGTPYAWLQSFGITSDFENAEELDHDGDGYFTWEEYLSNTSPVDPVSRFRILSIQPSGGTVAIVCETQPGRHYEIEFAEAPAPGQPLSWLPFASAAAGEFTETAGNTSSHGFSDDFSSITSGGEPTGASRFYRVRVSLP
ncbi:MAG: endonuclease/exonuclease/phosphatase family protein, partial [Verrucomicrobiota bacterium]